VLDCPRSEVLLAGFFAHPSRHVLDYVNRAVPGQRICHFGRMRENAGTLPVLDPAIRAVG